MIGLAAELPNTVKISAYADDICIWASGATRPQMRARLQHAVTIAAKYLRRQGLQLSTAKCSVLAFTRKRMTKYPIIVNGIPIPAVTHHRFLGVIIDRGLSWSRHVAALKSKLRSFVHVLRVVAGTRWGPRSGLYSNCTKHYL